MHVPDGFIDAPTSAVAMAAAGTSVAVALRRVGEATDDRVVPLAGLVSAFVFAMQMLNFPVAGGTSGHLMGGTLAAILVGPWLALVVMAVVLTVQAFVFADGGLSALGVNVVLMSITPILVGHGIFVAITRLVPRTVRATVVASAVGAWASVVAASVVFVGIFAVGGTVELSLGALVGSMVGVHSLIGLGEAIITAMTISAVIGTRPDLVHGHRHRTAMPTLAGVQP